MSCFVSLQSHFFFVLKKEEGAISLSLALLHYVYILIYTLFFFV